MHNRICRSEWWRTKVQKDLVPWALRDLDLGDNVLEIGPGPGLTTDVLRRQFARLTCLELDASMAQGLAMRLANTNVMVRQGDATAMPFEDSLFSGATCFTMLHHVPSAELQDRLLAEACRVIRPGSWLAGSDSRLSLRFRLLHVGDTMVLCDPDGFAARLERVGFDNVSVALSDRSFTFRGRKPMSCSLNA